MPSTVNDAFSGIYGVAAQVTALLRQGSSPGLGGNGCCSSSVGSSWECLNGRVCLGVGKTDVMDIMDKLAVSS